ncbi:PREDICTED: uncharacterized protein LOC104603907 [Nelumbo nucifera]|uniref:Uncharacterized protein LOC104603907 n=1 Tax=Nelumbo nucifera TaxID=4432 RepID=A0A1U8AU02_NELNU|nr:PREDICTED: uncharacterized protein LOC104603907 [Nelumbo nucifera]
MAYFSSLSDCDESAVEDIISQVKDLCVLEQVAAINCSGISDSILPTNLEARFRKLKSFPGSKPILKSPLLSFNAENKHSPTSSDRYKKKPSSSFEKESDHLPVESSETRTVPHKNEQETSKQAKASPNSPPLNETPISASAESSDKKGLKPKQVTGSVSSPSPSSNSSLEASSPPRQTCCFWYSPKRVAEKKGKENWVAGIGLDTPDWGKNEEILSDFSTLSLKHQNRRFKKALQEEEEITKEAEKVLKWAKQASARMEVYDIEDVLSDDEMFK